MPLPAFPAEPPPQQTSLSSPAAAPRTAAEVPPRPPETRKRSLEGYARLQDCGYFKMRAVFKDTRGHLLEVAQEQQICLTAYIPPRAQGCWSSGLFELQGS